MAVTLIVSAEAEQTIKSKKERQRNIFGRTLMQLKKRVGKTTVGLKNSTGCSPSNCITENTKHDLSKSFAKKKIIIKSIGLKKNGESNPKQKRIRSQSRSPIASYKFHSNKLKGNRLKERNRIRKEFQVEEVTKLDKYEGGNNTKRNQVYYHSNPSDIHVCDNAEDKDNFIVYDHERELLEKERYDQLVHEELKEQETTDCKYNEGCPMEECLENFPAHNNLDNFKKEDLVSKEEECKKEDYEVNGKFSEKDNSNHFRETSLVNHKVAQDESNCDHNKEDGLNYHKEITSYNEVNIENNPEDKSLDSICSDDKICISRLLTSDIEENKSNSYVCKEDIKGGPLNHEEIRLELETDVKDNEEGISDCFLDRSELDNKNNTSDIKGDDISVIYDKKSDVSDYKENLALGTDFKDNDEGISDCFLERSELDNKNNTSDIKGDDISVTYDKKSDVSDYKENSEQSLDSAIYVLDFLEDEHDNIATLDTELLNLHFCTHHDAIFADENLSFNEEIDDIFDAVDEQVSLNQSKTVVSSEVKENTIAVGITKQDDLKQASDGGFLQVNYDKDNDVKLEDDNFDLLQVDRELDTSDTQTNDNSNKIDGSDDDTIIQLHSKIEELRKKKKELEVQHISRRDLIWQTKKSPMTSEIENSAEDQHISQKWSRRHVVRDTNKKSVTKIKDSVEDQHAPHDWSHRRIVHDNKNLPVPSEMNKSVVDQHVLPERTPSIPKKTENHKNKDNSIHTDIEVPLRNNNLFKFWEDRA